MLIRLKQNLSSSQYGLINAGQVLHFPDKTAVDLLNAGAAEPIKLTQKETALKP